MQVPEHALVLKTSKRSYMLNYILILLLVLFLTMLMPFFDIQFSFRPRTAMEIIGTVLVFAFLLVISYLFEEPLFARTVRNYLISNEEFVLVEGIFRKNRVSIPTNSISDITLNKGVFGRMMNYGDIIVRGFKTDIIMKGISDPDVVYRIAKNKVSNKSSSMSKQKQRAKKAEPELEPEDIGEA